MINKYTLNVVPIATSLGTSIISFGITLLILNNIGILNGNYVLMLTILVISFSLSLVYFPLYRKFFSKFVVVNVQEQFPVTIVSKSEEQYGYTQSLYDYPELRAIPHTKGVSYYVTVKDYNGTHHKMYVTKERYPLLAKGFDTIMQKNITSVQGIETIMNTEVVPKYETKKGK